MDSAPPTGEDLLTIMEAVELLGRHGLTVSSKTLRRWAGTSALPAILLPSGQHRVRRSDVLALLQPTATEAS